MKKVKSSKGYERWATKHNMTTAAGTMIAIRDKEIELKRIKEITKHLQACIKKKTHYDGYRKNPNDKIYMMINKKDVEAYKVAFSEVEIFIKQFSHLKKEIMEGLKRGDRKSIFKELN